MASQPAIVFIPYTDEQLSFHSLTEDDLVPSYCDEVTETWQRFDNVVLDRLGNKVTLVVDHFTQYALLGSPPEVGSTLSTIYIPMVLQSYAGGW